MEHYLESISCNGTESLLLDCNKSAWQSEILACSLSDCIKIQCKNLTDGYVDRFKDYILGIFYEGEEGYICDANFT